MHLGEIIERWHLSSLLLRITSNAKKQPKFYLFVLVVAFLNFIKNILIEENNFAIFAHKYLRSLFSTQLLIFSTFSISLFIRNSRVNPLYPTLIDRISTSSNLIFLRKTVFWLFLEMTKPVPLGQNSSNVLH